MQGADYIIFAVIGASAILGAVRGFIREVVALITWLLAIWIAWHFSGFLQPYLGGMLSAVQKAWLARGIVLIGVLLLGAIAGHLLAWLSHTAAGLGVVDRLFGFFFGVTRGVVLVGFGAMLGVTMNLQHEPWWTGAHFAPYTLHVASWLERFAGESKALARRALATDGE
ncbi:MAG: CvpA family protein [Proteobacteria bacterium]|nr:CvpA family protein [Pseudomonadota bacterium]